MKTATALTMLVVVVLGLSILTGAALAAPPPKAPQRGPAPGGGAGRPGMGGPPPMTADSIVAGLTKELGLSKTQQAKLKPIYAKQIKDMQALRANKKLTPQQMGQKMGEIIRNTDKAMRKLLTPAQVRKLDDRELNGLTKLLGLSEAQRTKIRPILDSRRKKMEALWADKKLSSQQKMAKGKALYDSSLAQINKILTAAQKKKLADMQKMGAPGGFGPRGRGGPPPRR